MRRVVLLLLSFGKSGVFAMTSERWQQVEELYHAALEREPAERAAFLAQADPELCREVESLLAQGSGAILNQPAWKGAESLLESNVRRLSSGTELGCYRIEALIGAGGMGEVYRARDTRLGREVAIKVLGPRFGESTDRPQRLLREARAISALNHPNIVALYDICAEAGNEFLVMELVRGKTLDQIIGHRGIAVDKALQYAIPIADALARAHSAGVLHRDLKPSNIIINEDGIPKILDFGLAKLARAKLGSDSDPALVQQSSQTEQHAIAGTAAYMSPEQAEGKKLDARSDIFSFGAVLYEMITGRRAFQGESTASIISAVLRHEPEPPTHLAPHVPRELERVIQRCLRKDSDRRFHSMSDVKVELQEIREDSQSGQLPAPEMPGGSKRRTWLWAGLGAGVLVIVAIALALRLRSPSLESELRVVPFTSYTGYQGDPAFSPDGNEIAFVWAEHEQDHRHIYVKVIGTDTPLRLTSGDKDDGSPAWAPEGRSIAFVRRLSDTVNAIYTVSPLGGSERRIANINSGGGRFYEEAATAPATGIGDPGPGLSWSRDGKWLVTSGRPRLGDPPRILALSAETGEVRAFDFGRTLGVFSPALSPDSRTLAFCHSLGQSGTDIYVVRLRDDLRQIGAPRRLDTPSGFNLYPVWTADGSEVVFAHSNSTRWTASLWRVPATGSAPARPIEGTGEGVFSPAVAPYKNRLAFQHWFRDLNIWEIPISGTQASAVPRVLVASTRVDVVRPNAFSPDGRKIAFGSSRSGPHAVWMANTDGSSPTLLYGGVGFLSGSPVWSPDGKWIAFDSRKEGHAQIYVISSDGGAARRVTHDDLDDVVPCWSHDGKWIYFDSGRGQRFEIFKIPSSGGTPIQTTHNGGWASQESPDGRFIYYSRSRDSISPLLRAPVEGGPEMQILPAVLPRAWTISHQGIWFLQNTPNGDELQFLDFRSSKTRTFARLSNVFSAGLALSPDQHTLLYNRVDSQGTEILLAENFK